MCVCVYIYIYIYIYNDNSEHTLSNSIMRVNNELESLSVLPSNLHSTRTRQTDRHTYEGIFHFRKERFPFVQPHSSFLQGFVAPKPK